MAEVDEYLGSEYRNYTCDLAEKLLINKHICWRLRLEFRTQDSKSTEGVDYGIDYVIGLNRSLGCLRLKPQPLVQPPRYLSLDQIEIKLAPDA